MIELDETGLPNGPFAGPRAFAQIVRLGLARAGQEGWQRIILSDADFTDWPLGERNVVDLFDSWARSGRQLTLLARRFDEIPRRHPRFVQWRVKWSHIIEARACRNADPQEMTSAFWSPAWIMRRHDPVRCTGVSGAEPQRRFMLHEELHEWLRQSTPSFPATTLGL